MPMRRFSSEVEATSASTEPSNLLSAPEMRPSRARRALVEAIDRAPLESPAAQEVHRRGEAGDDRDALVAPGRGEIEMNRRIEARPVELALDVLDHRVEAVGRADDAHQAVVDGEGADARRTVCAGARAHRRRDRAARREGAPVEIDEDGRLAQVRGGHLEPAGDERQQGKPHRGVGRGQDCRAVLAADLDIDHMQRRRRQEVEPHPRRPAQFEAERLRELRTRLLDDIGGGERPSIEAGRQDEQGETERRGPFHT